MSPRFCARSWHVVQQPLQLQAAEIAGQGQSGLGAEAIRSAVPGVLGNELIDARVLPDQRIVQRLAAAPVPKNGGLALIGNADGGKIARSQSRARQGGTGNLLRVLPDFHRVVFDPTWLGKYLLMFFLRRRDDVAAAVKHDESRTCRSLIDRPYVSRHGVPVFLCLAYPASAL